MSLPPDRRRPRIKPHARALAAPLAHALLRVGWRVLHPEARQPFVEGSRPPPARRVYYAAPDGWRSPLLVVPPSPGAPGEPVIVAHALGLDSDAYRYGRSPLVAALAHAGFRVYLLAHRGDRRSIAPSGAGSFDFDDIVGRDVPAAVDAACHDAGYPRAFWVGHGFGGQVGVGAVRHLGDRLAGLVAINAAVRFTAPPTEVMRLLSVSRRLPRGWVVPGRLASLLTPWIDGERPSLDRFAGGATPGPRVRGVLRFGGGDVAVSLVRQIDRWVDAGALVDRTGTLDYGEAAAAASCPLFVITSDGDDLCRPAQATALVDTWGHEDRSALRLGEAWGHDDVLFGDDAPRCVHAPVAAWLEERRRGCWERTARAG